MSDSSSGRWFTAGSAGFLRSTALNVATQVVVYGAAVVCVPLIIGRLGADTFGLLSIFWIIVGAVPFLDLGLSQATVRFLSSAMGRNDRMETDALLRQILKTAALVGLVLCIIVAAIAALVPILPISIDPDLRDQARQLGWMTAAAVPALMVAGPMRGVAQSARRFDLVNALQGGTGFVQWAGTLAVVLAGGGLPDLLILTIGVRYFSAAAAWIVVRQILPGFALSGVRPLGAGRRNVYSFGGWIFVSQAIGPMLLLSERLAITGLVSLEAQGWYSAPTDALLRFLILPVGVSTALFPFLAAKSDEPAQRDQMARMVVRSMRLVLILMIPIVLALLVYGDQVLKLWLGSESAIHLGGVWTFLVVGLLLHSLAQVPYVALQALDAPRDIAILLLVEFPAYLPVFILLTSSFGIVGAALAWMLRVGAELVVLLWRTRHHLSPLVTFRPDRAFISVATFGIIGLVLLVLVRSLSPLPSLSMLGLAGFGIAYAIFVWTVVLDQDERAAVTTTFRIRRSGTP